AACDTAIGRAVIRTAAGRIAEHIRLIGRHLLVLDAQGERRSVALVRERAIKQTRMNGCSPAVAWCGAARRFPRRSGLSCGARMARSAAVHPAVTPRILTMAAFCG